VRRADCALSLCGGRDPIQRVGTAGNTRQFREIRSGAGYLFQNDLRAYFGLADHAGPVAVEVRMPGGRLWRWPALSVDRLHVLELSPSSSAMGTLSHDASSDQ
jgi:hypothetical protein